MKGIMILVTVNTEYAETKGDEKIDERPTRDHFLRSCARRLSFSVWAALSSSSNATR